MHHRTPRQTTLANIAALMTLTALAACGGGGTTTSETASAPAPAPAPAPTPAPAPAPATGDQAIGCFNFAAAQGHRDTVQYRFSGATSLTTSTYDRVVGAAVSFEGNTATEIIETTRFAGSTEVVSRDYLRQTEPTEITHFGSNADLAITINGVAHSSTLHAVFDPSFADRSHALRVGESVTQTTVARNQSSNDGVVQPPTTLTTTTTTRFVGIGPVTVPAGTFSACLFADTVAGSAVSTQRWVQLGRGILVKQVTSDGSGTQTMEATSNGGKR
jgi:hypothetical protein